MADLHCIEALTELGFTGLEAEVYTFLLQEAPATGYRVAQGIGKPVANTYKALESLVNKGALLCDEGANRVYRAVPAEELLAQLARVFQERKQRASEALASLRGAADDNRVYQLQSVEQVFERARAMLARSRELVLADLFPMPVQLLREDLEAAATRGVKVAVQTYEPAEFTVAHLTRFPRGPELMEALPVQLLLLVVDGSEHLLAFLSRDGREVHQAIWSSSLHLSFTLNCFMASEFIFGGVLGDPELPPGVRELTRKHSQFFPFEVPGYLELLRRFGRTAPAGGAEIPPNRSEAE